jgi:hypothetical protein
MAEPVEVNPEHFDEIVRDSKVPVMVDFCLGIFPCHRPVDLWQENKNTRILFLLRKPHIISLN